MSEFVSREQIQEAVAFVRRRTGQQPAIGLVLGSGLSGLAEAVTSADIIPYQEIPHWPASTVPAPPQNDSDDARTSRCPRARRSD